MTEQKPPLRNELAEVWNDTVRVRDLAVATLLGISSGLTCFLLAKFALLHLSLGNPEQQKGYALLFGILGCIGSGILSATLFKPKREVRAGADVCLREALEQMGVDPEEEGEAVRESSPENRRELEELGILEELTRWK